MDQYGFPRLETRRRLEPSGRSSHWPFERDALETTLVGLICGPEPEHSIRQPPCIGR
ncbi:hypothetical protein HALLA_11250 [Halostagnicola larsenii XH-48]|uniref:Uncharacterized protein n=1 Tax=Halostagnicola larsenii XH-48 TaxID=797299 RepID=W0JQ89_9EURY|nr:hypothetical protein HALLA_11250 [Halostagnicola larsenii XH-48]